MTPTKKRAIEIIEMFDGKVETRGEFDIYYVESVELENKKLCAIIVVEQILNELFGWSSIEFYKEVKKEIENYNE